MDTVLPLLEEVSDLVRRLLPEVLAKRHDVAWKPDGSPVTTADLLLEERIGALLRERIPGIQVIGEETYRSGEPIRGPWIAVLDPIDGTENFCSGLKEWGVSLSIWREGAHRGSMLLLPELGDRMVSGAIAKVPRSRIVGFSSSFHPEIGIGVSENPESRIMGCSVYNLYNVIRGSFAVFLNPKGAYVWDVLAGIALAHEAGCHIHVEEREYVGQFLEPDRRYRFHIRHKYDFHHGQGTID